METPEAQRLRPLTDIPDAPRRSKFRRRLVMDDDAYVCVQFAETKVYRSGHVEYTSGRRVFKRHLEVGVYDDLHTMSLDFLNCELLYDLENVGYALRVAKYDDDDMTFHQLVLIKIT